MKPIRLLLVDDQELFSESLKVLLETDTGLEVAAIAKNGREAVQYCYSGAPVPDVILMDIQMPVMNGVEATKEIKRNFPACRVIILTTFNEIHYVIDAMKAGAEGYLLKAVQSQDLIAGIKLVHRGGALITQGMAKQLVERISRPDPAAHSRYGLSERERDVLMAVSKGMTNKQIADRLFLSEGTVRNYISGIYSKLDVRDRVQAAKKALEEEII